MDLEEWIVREWTWVGKLGEMGYLECEYMSREFHMENRLILFLIGCTRTL